MTFEEPESVLAVMNALFNLYIDLSYKNGLPADEAGKRFFEAVPNFTKR